MIHFKYKLNPNIVITAICLLLGSCVSLEKYEAQQNNLDHTKKIVRSMSEENDILNADKVELMRKNIAINEQLIRKEKTLDSLYGQYKNIKAKNDALMELSSGARNDALVFQQMLAEMAKKFDDFQIKNTEQTKAIQKDIRKIQADTRKIGDKVQDLTHN